MNIFWVDAEENREKFGKFQIPNPNCCISYYNIRITLQEHSSISYIFHEPNVHFPKAMLFRLDNRIHVSE